MAFSKTPTVDTYSSVRVPMAWDLALNSVPSTDDYSLISGLTNMVPYKKVDAENELYSETRYGLFGSGVTTGSSKITRGCYVWEKTATETYYFVVVLDGVLTTVYSSTDGTAWAVANTFTEAKTTTVRFTEFINSSNVKTLVLVTGTKGYIYTTNAAGTEITDVDFPTPHVPFPVFLDGYLFLAKESTGDIYNSNLDNPAAWTAGDFISSEMYPDDIKALLKIQNYVLAVGTEGSEFFYDAANATASPLARVSGGSLPIGTVYPDSIASSLDRATFLATTNDGGMSMAVIEGTNYKLLPAEVLLHIFTNQIRNGKIVGTGCRGAFLRMQGEVFYIFNFSGDTNGFDADANYTLMYSFNTKKWIRLVVNFSNRYPVFYTNQGNSKSPLTFVCGHTTDGVFFGTTSAGSPSDVFFGISYQIRQEILVPPQTFGTMNLKAMGRAGLYYINSFDLIAASLLWSDDNCQTWSDPRDFSGTMASNFPFITQLGMFRSRAFKVVLQGNSSQVYYLECDINKGMR